MIARKNKRKNVEKTNKQTSGKTKGKMLNLKQGKTVEIT